MWKGVVVWLWPTRRGGSSRNSEGGSLPRSPERSERAGALLAILKEEIEVELCVVQCVVLAVRKLPGRGAVNIFKRRLLVLAQSSYVLAMEISRPGFRQQFKANYLETASSDKALAAEPRTKTFNTYSCASVRCINHLAIAEVDSHV